MRRTWVCELRSWKVRRLAHLGYKFGSSNAFYIRPLQTGITSAEGLQDKRRSLIIAYDLHYMPRTKPYSFFKVEWSWKPFIDSFVICFISFLGPDRTKRSNLLTNRNIALISSVTICKQKAKVNIARLGSFQHKTAAPLCSTGVFAGFHNQSPLPTTVKPLLISGHLRDLPKCRLNRGGPFNGGCKNCAMFAHNQH